MGIPLSSFYGSIIRFAETHLLACPSRKYLHLQCPGCGLQRSLIALLRGDISDSFIVYPATIPILLLLVFLVLHLKFRYATGAFVIRGMYIFCAAIILVHYLYIIATNQLMVA